MNRLDFDGAVLIGGLVLVAIGLAGIVTALVLGGL